MGRWEKWYQIYQSPDFQKRNFGETPLENALILDLPEGKMFPTMGLAKARESTWKKHVQQYGNPEDEMNVIVYMPLKADAIKAAIKLPLSIDYEAIREEAKKLDLDERISIGFPHVDAIMHWGITLLCTRTLSTAMPMTDLTITRISYAVNNWKIPYIDTEVSFPLFKDLKAMKKAFEDEGGASGEAVDLLVREISHYLDFSSLPTLFKISPKREILDIRRTLE